MVDWTVFTADGAWLSRWEYSAALTEARSAGRDGGKAKLAEYGITAAPDPLA
ncbi:hypothetical protein [Streptomyces montanus]|uniref:hypothetical protein n=1 Tax=Streptomyces montanus TaxID=2580423 RepID=UPI003CCC6BD1